MSFKKGGGQGPHPMSGKGKVVAWLREHASYDSDNCLIFPFSRNAETGYGTFGYLGKMPYAHRFMCELIHGPAPADRPYCAHSCGKGHEGCVNPKHLSWKSVRDNLLDRREHGTVRYNTHGKFGRLGDYEIAMIRALKGIATQSQLAALFGVKRPAIQYWQKHDRPHAKPSMSATAVERRRLKAANENA